MHTYIRAISHVYMHVNEKKPKKKNEGEIEGENLKFVSKKYLF